MATIYLTFFRNFVSLLLLVSFLLGGPYSFTYVSPLTAVYVDVVVAAAYRLTYGPVCGARWRTGCWRCARRRRPCRTSSASPSTTSTGSSPSAKLESKQRRHFVTRFFNVQSVLSFPYFFFWGGRGGLVLGLPF